MPRLSVDIDLTYLPIEDRETTLSGIDAALDHIRDDLLKNLRGVDVQRIAGGGNNDTRVLVRQGTTEIKIETSPVARGTVHPPELRAVTDGVADAFGFAEMQVVSFEDLFGGKLHAAVDRQHPRDLFDVKLLYDNEGLTDVLFRTFLIYVASSGRPPHELIRPSLSELEDAFVKEFEGMTIEPVSLIELKDARARLTNDLRARLDDKAMRFLLTLHDTEPDFDAIGLPQAAALPANDNSNPTGDIVDADIAPSEKLHRVVLSIARLIGRQMAQEEFERMRAATANDNMPPVRRVGTQEDHSGDDGN